MGVSVALSASGGHQGSWAYLDQGQTWCARKSQAAACTSEVGGTWQTGEPPCILSDRSPSL